MHCRDLSGLFNFFTWIILLDPLHAWPCGIKTAQWNVFCHGKASEGCENCKSKHWAWTEEERESVECPDPFLDQGGGSR